MKLPLNTIETPSNPPRNSGDMAGPWMTGPGDTINQNTMPQDSVRW